MHKLISSLTVGSGSVSPGSYSSKSPDVVAPKLTFPEPFEQLVLTSGIWCSAFDLHFDPFCLLGPGDPLVGEFGGFDLLDEFLEDLPEDVRTKLLGMPSACIPADIPCGEMYLRLLPLLVTVPARQSNRVHTVVFSILKSLNLSLIFLCVKILNDRTLGIVLGKMSDQKQSG